MPEEGITLKPHNEILRYESIALIASHAGRLGFKKIRITGGEPLIKRDIVTLVEMIRLTGRFEEITMTTNASLLTEEKARRLKDAGLNRVNISLDTLDEQEFENITRGGKINDVFSGIDAAKKAGLFPIKINMIIFENTKSEEMEKMRAFCRDNGLILQTIKQFSLYNKKENSEALKTYSRPISCEKCNRLRLTSDGYFKPCLFSNKEIKIDLNNIDSSITQAINAKPFRGTICINRVMSQIGG
jgi:cyclic pyranopterin phosphate synthase